MKIKEWIVIDATKQPPILKCKRCGKERKIHLPATVEDFSKQAEAFGETHRICKKGGNK